MKLKELINSKYRSRLQSQGLLFAQIGRDETFDWLDEDSGKTLDVMYFIQHSANKNVYFEDVLGDYLETLCDEETICSENTICGYLDSTFSVLKTEVVLKYKTKWNRLYDTLSSQISALDNEYITQTETPNITHTETPNITKSENGSVSGSDSVNGQSNVNTYGFNSGQAVPQANGSNSSSGTNSQTTNITNTETGTRTNTETGMRTTTIKGLRGQNYSDAFIKQIEAMQWNFYEEMMNDVDTLITLPKYDY